MYFKCILLYFILHIFLVKTSFANVTSEVSRITLTHDVGDDLSFEEEELKESDSKQIKLGNTILFKRPSLLLFPASQYRSGRGNYDYKNLPTEIYQAPLPKSNGVKHKTAKTHPPKTTNKKKNTNKDKNNNKAQASKTSTKSAESSSKCTKANKCSVKKAKPQPSGCSTKKCGQTKTKSTNKGCSTKNKCSQTKTKPTKKRTARPRCYATSSNSSESSGSSCSDSESSETESDSSDYTSSDDGCCKNIRKRCCCRHDCESDSSSESDESTDSSDSSEDSYSSDDSYSSEDSDSSEDNCCCKHACDSNSDYTNTDNGIEEMPSGFNLEFTINSHSNDTVDSDWLSFESSTFSLTSATESIIDDDVVSLYSGNSLHVENIIYVINTTASKTGNDTNVMHTTVDSDVILIAVSPPMVYLDSTSSDSDNLDAEDFDETDSDHYYATNEYTIDSLTREYDNSKNMDNMTNVNIRKARSSSSERYQLRIPNTENNERIREENLPLPEDEVRLMNLNGSYQQHLQSLHSTRHKNIGDFINKTSSEIVHKDSIKEKLDKIFQQLNSTQHERRSSVGIETNIKDIEEHFKETPLWHSSAGGNANYKEELQIKKVHINKNHVIDRPVSDWVGLNKKAVGRYNNRLTLVTADGVNFRVNNVEFAEAISAMFIFELWNTETQSLDTILITARDARADWYSFTGDNTLEQLWTWDLMDPVTDIMVFQVNNQWKVLIIYTTKQNSGVEKNSYSAIFGTNLWKNWWLEQKFSHGGRPTISADSAFIAVPRPEQNNVVFYKYNGYKQTYEENDVIESPGVTQVVAFTSGFNSFFAVTGDNSGIYQVKSGSLIHRELEQYHLNHVESWLPINLDYYTNDMVLMFQHKLDHYTHTSTVIEALKWNRENEKFELLEHQSCYTHQTEVHGFACVTDAEGENGIKGAAVVHYNNQPHILLASEQYSPLLFDVETAKVERMDPVEREVLNIYHKLEELQKNYVTQKNTMDDAVQQLASHKRKIKGRNWTIENLRASSINLIGNFKDFLTADSSLTFGGQMWVESTPLLRYKTAIEANAKRVKVILDKFKKAVKKSDKLENIKAPFYFNGGLAVKGKVVTETADIKFLNTVDVDEVFKHVLQKSQDNMYHVKERKKDFLNVNKLVVSGSINGISISDLSQSIPIILNDNLKLETPLKVIGNVRLKGLINNIDVNKDIVTISGSDDFGTPTKIYNQYLKFSHLEATNRLNIEEAMNGMKLEEQILRKQFERDEGVTINEVEELTLTAADIGDLKVDTVNGIKWEEFENNLVFKNAINNLEELHVSGEIIALENVAINTLNKLAFPSEYVSNQETSPITISGSKIFASELTAYSLDCSQVNGISPKIFVRLSADQQLGNFTFYDLSITEKLDIGGDIVGKDLHKILPNPLITETNVISSNIIFKNLKVTGNIYVEKNINGTDSNALASDLIYKSDNYAVIHATKHFMGDVTVKGGINVTSGSINDLKIDEFITSDTEQYFKRDLILGNVRFHKVIVKGLFGNLNMTDLTENAVRIDVNDQIIQGEVHFRSLDYSYDDYSARDLPEDPVQINNLVVMENCNGWRVPEDVVSSRKARQKIHSVLTTFEYLLVKELFVDGDIITQHKVAGVDIRQFDTERFSLTRNQEITGLFEINNCNMEANLDVKLINGILSDDIISAKQKVDNVLQDLFTGKRVIENLHVAGNLMTNGINSIQLQNLAENAIWLNKKNYISGGITFLDPIQVNELQVDGDFGEVFFPDFLFNVIRKDDFPLELRGTIHFANTLHITKTLDVEYINNMLATNIILKNNIEDVYNNVFVNGDIHVNNLNINGHFNSINLQNLQNVLSSPREDEFIMNGNIEFQNGHRITNLRVNGSVNNYILNDVVDSLIWLNRDSNSNAEVIFRNPVTVLGNIQVKSLYNGIHLQSLIEDVVYVNEDCNIDGIVSFKEPLFIGGILNIKDSILCDSINNHRMSVWRDNAIYLDRPQVLSGIHRMNNVTMKGNLNVKIINNVTLNTTITLNTDQTLLTDLHVDTWKAEGNISVANLVNTRKLKDLFDNTLLNYGNQTVLTPLVFRSNVAILKNIVMNYINSIPVENIVTLNTNQDLNGRYIFDSAVTAHDMQIGGKLSLINFNEWISNAVFTSENGAKTINGRWFVKGNVTIVNKMVGNEIVEGHNLTQIQNYLADTERSIRKYNNYLSSSYKQICHDLVVLSKEVQNLKQFKGLQEVLFINTTTAKFNVFNVKIKKNIYILINYVEKCHSEVWHWLSEKEILNKIGEIQTGAVLYWNNIFVNGKEFISSKSSVDKFCKVKGINVWDFDNQNVKHNMSLPNVENISPSERNPTEIISEELGVVRRYQLVNKTLTPQKPVNCSGKHTNDRAKENVKFDIIKIVIENVEMCARTLQNRIEIYDKADTLLQTITTNHPTSLTTVRINNHHTLLAFIDNQQSVNIFMYNGLEMFKQVAILNVKANKLMAVEMRYLNSWGNFILVIGEKFIKILKVAESPDIETLNMEYCNGM